MTMDGFPWVAMAPLLVSRVAEGVAFTVVYPYMPQLMRDLGVKDTQVGVYAALAVRPEARISTDTLRMGSYKSPSAWRLRS
jgi:hypothetical protein